MCGSVRVCSVRVGSGATSTIKCCCSLEPPQLIDDGINRSYTQNSSPAGNTAGGVSSVGSHDTFPLFIMFYFALSFM